jgi:phospholipid/cholesterol/gamma-HCH transport system ATP-binding protein
VKGEGKAMATIEVCGLRMQYGDKLIQEDVNFNVQAGCIFAIMGGSGCGKSTLLRHMVGLLAPHAGEVRVDGHGYWREMNEDQRRLTRRRYGMLFQSGALWSTLSVSGNVHVPLELHWADRPEAEREARVQEVLKWVGLAEQADAPVAGLSGGQVKRAGLARAIVAEPEVIFLDEPSAGLDPITSLRMDELILQLRDRTGAAVVLVSHERDSLFKIADDGIFLDADSKRPAAHGRPADLQHDPKQPQGVLDFLQRKDGRA